MVNRAFARKFFNDENPIGKRFGDQGPGSSSLIEIVGVTADAKYGNVREELRPMFYRPLFQNFEKRPYQVHVRTAGNPAAVIEGIRREIQSMDQDISVYDVRTIDEVVHRLLQHDRMFAVLASAFGLLALVLTSIGIYHSHPDADAYFSETDLKNSCAWFTFVVLSVRGGRFDHARGYRPNLEQTRAEPEPLFYPNGDASPWLKS